MATQRITIVLDDELVNILRDYQSAIIKKSKANCSFSNVVNLVLKVGVKEFKF